MVKDNKSESIAYKYLRNLGYSVCLGKFETDQSGVPDFIIEKDGEKIYVEVKAENYGGLTSQQINFMANLIEKTYVLVVDNITNNIKIFKIIVEKVETI